MSVAKDAVWLITGCSSGFGREMALEALRRGWRVAVTARSTDAIQDIVADHKDRAIALALDVTDADQRNSAFQAAEDRFGRVDVLVNNAGLGYFSSVEEADLTEIRALFEANFFSAAALIQRALPGMRERGHGWIVNIGSIAGLAPFSATGFYAATKHAIEGMSRVLRHEVGPLGIQVMCVEPGGFRTEFSNRPLNGRHTAIAGYEETVGKVMGLVLARKRDQKGDPARGARAILDAVASDAPPHNLILGQQCYDAVQRVTSELQADMARWRDASLGADFPQP